ncbi:MAG: DUF4097 family beta strand repeat-containing protein [Ferruginibacter sp.]
MKKTILILLISCTVSTLFAQNDSKQDAFLTKSLAGQSVKQVEVETSGGNITVESTAVGQERVEVFIWPSGRNKGASVSKEEIQKRLDELYDLKIAVADNQLTAIAKPKKRNMNWKNGLSISFKVFLAKDVSTHLTTSGGNIDLRALSGEQKITTSGGNLTIDNVKGKLRGTTSGGNIYVKNSDDNIDLTTSGGDIEANNCTGGIKLVTSGGSILLTDLNGNVDATTSGGNVRANDIRGELEASTSGGNINLLALSCNVSTSTSGGNIRVAMNDPSKFIKIRNSGGKIELELPSGKGYDLDLSGDKIKTGNLANFSGKVEDDRVNGKLNGGGTQVTADAGGGRLILTLK